VTTADIERELARLRAEDGGGALDVRASTMTHVAWVPERWLAVGRATLDGLSNRHPSRTIILVPQPEADGELDASVELRRFSLEGLERQVSTEVIEIHLSGPHLRAPASIVAPLLRSDLPVFLRWRGRPDFSGPAFDQLTDVADRLIVDSGEWPDVPAAYRELETWLDRIAASDIAWRRTIPWRLALATLWPGVASLRRLHVAGPAPEAHLIAGWLRSRLEREVALDHEPAETVEAVSVDGEAVAATNGNPESSSELLSEELDSFSRDRIFEAALRAT
jgi:glucose-6-phosphate dehydrogenase assembly protein OpcA